MHSHQYMWYPSIMTNNIHISQQVISIISWQVISIYHDKWSPAVRTSDFHLSWQVIFNYQYIIHIFTIYISDDTLVIYKFMTIYQYIHTVQWHFRLPKIIQCFYWTFSIYCHWFFIKKINAKRHYGQNLKHHLIG